MAPDEFRRLRQSLGLSQAALGRVLGLDARTIRRYEQPPGEASARAPHPAAAVALRWLCKGRLPDLAAAPGDD
jgi:transcriptional regulator with XRE-family HTH domain